MIIITKNNSGINRDTYCRLFCGWVGVVSVLQAYQELATILLKPATRIPLQPNHTETPTYIEPRTIRPMW